MIESTFLHLPRVGATKEQAFWKQGVKTWHDFLGTPRIKGLSTTAKSRHDDLVKQSKLALATGDSAFFTCMPSTAHWRLWPQFREEAVYVDIETNWHHDVTVLGIYDGEEVMQFVKGKNLTQAAVEKHLKGKLIVTYNGASFDLPVIRRRFGNVIPAVPHFDTMHLARRLGYRGGLKALERSIGIRRPEEVEGVTGHDALHLWELYRASGEPQHLKTLLAYNEEDIVNLAAVAKRLVAEGTTDLMRNHF